MWVGQRSKFHANASVISLLLDINRLRGILAINFLVFTLISILYIVITPPDYVGSLQILLQPRRVLDSDRNDSRFLREVALRDEQAQTELRILQSSSILKDVFLRQNLTNSVELRDGYDGVWAFFYRVAHKLAYDTTLENVQDETYGRFINRVQARLVGESAVIDLSYRSRDPDQAVRIVNGIASAFLLDRMRTAVAQAKSVGPLGTHVSATLQEEERQILLAITTGKINIETQTDVDLELLGPALIPLQRSFPRIFPVIMICFIYALTSSFIILIFYGFSSQKIRSPEHLKAKLLLGCLGSINCLGGFEQNYPETDGYSENEGSSGVLNVLQGFLRGQSSAGLSPVIVFATWGESTAGQNVANRLINVCKLETGGDEHEAKKKNTFRVEDNIVEKRLTQGRKNDVISENIMYLTALSHGATYFQAFAAREIIIFLIVKKNDCRTGDIHSAIDLIERIGVRLGGVIFIHGDKPESIRAYPKRS